MKTIFDAVKEAVPVAEAAELVGIRVGLNRMALCPFHDDHHPSLRIYDDHFHCFSCRAHGDAVSLVARTAGIRPIEAARILAERFGVEDPRPVFHPQNVS